MSKLATKIDDVLTGQHRTSRLPAVRYTDIKFTSGITHNQYGFDKEVMLDFRLRTNAWVNEQEWNNTEVRSTIIRDLKRSLIEEVFGEFRPLIIELRSSLYDGDTVRTRALLAELENQMFTDGL